MFKDEMASAADLAGAGWGAGADGSGGPSTEMAEIASPVVRPSVETV